MGRDRTPRPGHPSRVPGTIAVVSLAGRFAPSPTGELHLGNLRTALVAWLSARSQGLGFVVRVEDLDRITSSVANERLQLRALASIGLDWDGDVVRQSERFDLYNVALVDLHDRGLTYECFCTRREVREAASAPNGPSSFEGAYPGTCRNLSEADRHRMRAAGRRAALRLCAESAVVSFVDDVCGEVSATVDDFVLRRNDGVPAYNLAVVVDDAAQNVGEVVRGDDLLATTPRQIFLQGLLGLPTPRYRHVPLVVGPDGVRLAKRHGAVTISQLVERGIEADDVVALLATSLRLARPGERVVADDLIDRFDVHALPRHAWTLPENLQRSEA